MEQRTNDRDCRVRRAEDAHRACDRNAGRPAGVCGRLFRAGWRSEGVTAGERFRLFLRSPLWLGAPLPGIAAFVATFLIRRFGDDLATADAAAKGAIFAAVAMLAWAIGIWVATDPSPDEPEEESPRVEAACARMAGRCVLRVLLIVGVFALLCASQIEAMATGEASLAAGFSGIVLKAIAIAAVLVPVWLDLRRR